MENLINALNNSGIDVLAFYNSTFFSVVKFILGIYVVVLFADIILLLIQRGLSGDIRETLLGMNVPAELIKKKKKLNKRWTGIKRWKLLMQSNPDIISGKACSRMETLQAFFIEPSSNCLNFSV